MNYNLEENIHKITLDFIGRRIPTKEEDKVLYDKYRKTFDFGELRLPVFIGTEGLPIGYPVLSCYGFATLSIDSSYMGTFLIPQIKEIEGRWQSMSKEEIHLLRASLIEFALLGCIEAQDLLFKIGFPYGEDLEYVTDIVMHRWPNLQRLSRFLTAQEGAGRNEDSVPSYAEALSEVRAGSKRRHWIWYIFPQMYGIKGTHSGNSLYFGIRGRMEATQYICHPLLRQRLIELVEAILQTGKTIYQIFPEVDAIKVRSCIELFSSVSNIDIFKELRKQHRI